MHPSFKIIKPGSITLIISIINITKLEKGKGRKERERERERERMSISKIRYKIRGAVIRMDAVIR